DEERTAARELPVSEHALAAPEREDGRANLLEWHALADRDPERRRELLVGDGADARGLQREFNRDDDALAAALERARPVAEPEIGGRDPLELAGHGVVELDRVEY